MFPEAIILDFDGLILDTEVSIFEEWQRVYRRHGRELSLDLWQHTVGSHGVFEPAGHLATLTGQPVDRDALWSEVRVEHRQRCQELPLLPGVGRLIHDALQKNLATAVASSASAAWVEPWLVQHGLRELFGCVCTRDDVERVKPEPDLFLLAAERLGATPGSCIVFEDSPNGARAARAAGMACVVVPNTITGGLSFPEVPLTLTSLADHTLADIIVALDRNDQPGRDPGKE